MLFIEEIIQAVENCLEIKTFCVTVVILIIFVRFFSSSVKDQGGMLSTFVGIAFCCILLKCLQY